MRRTATPSFAVEVLRFCAPLIILAAGSLALVGLWALQTPPQSTPSQERELPLVRTAVVEANPHGIDIVVNGTVVPYREIQIAAEVSGRIVEKKTRSGYFVTRGTTLIQIDPINYSLDARRAAEEVKQAESQIQENAIEGENIKRLIELARADLDIQNRDLERFTLLHERASVTTSDLDQATRAHLATEVALAQLENQLRLTHQRRDSLETAVLKSKVMLERANEDLKRTTIIAPCEGIIVRDETEEDSYVQAGRQLLTLEDTSKTEVRCQLRAEDIYWLWLQQQGVASGPGAGAAAGAGGVTEMTLLRDDYQLPEASASVEHTIAGVTYRWKGVLKRYEGSGLDTLTRTAPVRVEVPNPREVFVEESTTRREVSSTTPLEGPPALTRGFFVKVTIHATPDTALLQVPEVSIQPGSRILRVVQDAGGEQRLEIESVQVIRRADGVALLRSPQGTLKAGDRVVISPLSFVEQGMPVHEIDF